MDEAKLREVLSDEEYVKELLAMESEQQVQLSLEERGIELSLDQIRQIGEFVRKVQNGEVSQEQLEHMANGELTEDELEQVAGGSFLAFALTVIIGGAAIGGTMNAVIYSW